MSLLVFQRIAFQALFQLIYFPIWWYTIGLKYFLTQSYNMFLFGNSILSPGLWLKNIFVPMYGQYDFQGRLISFLMRFFQVIIRGIGLIFWAIICLLAFVIWFTLPLVVFLGLIRSFI